MNKQAHSKHSDSDSTHPHSVVGVAGKARQEQDVDVLGSRAELRHLVDSARRYHTHACRPGRLCLQGQKENHLPSIIMSNFMLASVNA